MLTSSLSTSHAPQRLAVVDDHGIIRGVFLTLIEDTPDLIMSWMAPSLNEARASLSKDRPDFLVCDVWLPDGNGFDFVREALTLAPDLPVLMVSAHNDKTYPEQARAAGARGFISKAASLEQLLEAISTIQQGGQWFSGSSAGRGATAHGLEDEVLYQRTA
ncbi:response regulator [Brevifollis gellanilyticus]|uniref:response regulator n=1 Tax=Brevifollis gellanilyticus TaxID=748831 RepID=UPI001478830C|nr:response regulator transcription factor [Brevifollis gellanilyticus]